MSYKRITKENLCYSKWLQEGNSPSELYYFLKELEDKIEQKKMLELPFLVGQDAFIIEDNEVVMGVVNGIWWQNEFLIEVRYGKDKYGWRYAQRLKDGIFSTKAEAEKKLEELSKNP